jgi:hypothetical protein
MNTVRAGCAPNVNTAGSACCACALGSGFAACMTNVQAAAAASLLLRSALGFVLVHRV